VLEAETSPICSTFPQLFPDQIDKNSSSHPCKQETEVSEEATEE
jgi:hypothetical protein